MLKLSTTKKWDKSNAPPSGRFRGIDVGLMSSSSCELDVSDSAGDTIVGPLGEELEAVAVGDELTAVALEVRESAVLGNAPSLSWCGSSAGKLDSVPLFTISVIRSKYTSRLKNTS